MTDISLELLMQFLIDIFLLLVLSIEGAKYIGKTWTAKYHSKSAFFVADPNGNYRNRQYAEMHSSLVLPCSHPRLMNYHFHAVSSSSYGIGF